MTREESLAYSPVLMHMIELLGSNDHLTFGDALKQAMAKSQLPAIPEHIEQALVLASYRIITNRGIPGAAEA